MRRIYTYILALALLTLSVACQRANLPEDSQVNQPVELPTGAIGSKATITFSTADLEGHETRGVLNPLDPVIEPSKDVKTLHLIVFDKNGMLVEVCEAAKLGTSDHVDPDTGETHEGGRHYTVTLTVTDEPRIIHYVANCPVDQVVYGHETSIIGNMFVDRNGSDGAKTQYETSYWARIEVPYILVEENEGEQADGSNKIVVSLVDEIKGKFTHVPLLRNYAEITVVDSTDNTFYFEGFTVYNLLNRGTVAPYNSNTQRFQSFIYTNQEGGISNYSYPQISSLGYEGHALTSAQLITDFIRNDDGKVKIYKSNEPFYVYERKVSVMTDEEEKWRESPPHIIIKGRYNHGKQADENSPVYYYKMDLVYTGKDADGNDTDIKYYNILRNFKYKFTLTQVHDEGYTSLDLAVAGAAGNNISGSSSTSKLTNVSDNEGRLWVSYTDITLVTNDAVTFRYKYVPNYYGSEGSAYTQNEIKNDLVKFENTVDGEVITGFVKATTDITSGEWKGWREVTISVNAPDDIIRQQTVLLKTNNVNLNRQIRFTLRKKLTMEVACSPKKVTKNSLQDMTVYVKLPTGMTDDMFPLELNMETLNRTLSPDATKNTIPVTAGNSIIDGKRDELSYYYTVIIPTFDDYKAQPAGGFPTYWRTNKAENASTFYVDNKYFNQGSDSWQNYTYEFSNVSCSSSALGVGQDVTISFTMADGAINKPVTISLKGMTDNGAYVKTVTPSLKNVTLTGFKTTTDTGAVSFTLNADDYNIAEATGDRQTYKFNGAFGATSLEAEADVEVDFTFNISEEALSALRSLNRITSDAPAPVPMSVILNRMHPADDQLTYSQARAEGDRYIYHINAAGLQTIRLATTEDIGGPCTVTLQADYFDTETVEIQQVGREFKSLNITNNRIAQGLGRSVNITFQLADVDKNAQKDVTVTLVNMAVNGKNTFTFNTGDSNAVSNNNGTYTIKNVVTADDPAGELKVTITAKGYSSKETTFNKERPTPKFTTSLSKTNLGTSAGEEVELSFSSDDLVDGMDVTLELDGLRPQTDLPTRAVTRYVYTVNGTGQQKITLVTTESTTTSKTCSIQLKAEKFGFEDSQILSVKQSNNVTYSGKNINVTYSVNRPDVSGGSGSSSYSATIDSITVNGGTVDYKGSATYTYSNNPGTLTVALDSISITDNDLNDSTVITFECTITRKKGSSTGTVTATFTKTIKDLGLKLSN